MNIKTDMTVVTGRGQTSIPAELRKQLHLHKGKRLLWRRLSDSELHLQVLADREPDALAMLGFARRFRKTRTTASWMAELRAGEKK